MNSLFLIVPIFLPIILGALSFVIPAEKKKHEQRKKDYKKRKVAKKKLLKERGCYDLS